MVANDPFLDAIRADPDNDTPRLVYADWLDERGDPLGEYVRLGCQRLDDNPAAAAVRARLKELLDLHRVRWFGRLPNFVTVYTLVRGFIESITLRRQQLIHFNRLFEHAHLLRQVELYGARGRLESVLNAPNVTRLERLYVGRVPLDDVRRIAHAPRLAGLRVLRLNWATVDDVIELLESPLPIVRVFLLWYGNQIPQLGYTPRGLTLWVQNFSMRWQAEHLPRLWKCPAWERVESLWMNYRKTYRDGVCDAVASELAQCSYLTNLRDLRLGGNDIDDAQIAVLAASPGLKKLESLDLYKNKIGDTGATQIAATWSMLKALDLGKNAIASTGAQAIAANMTQLESLDLADNNIFFPGLRALAQAPALAGLKELKLKGNPAGGLGAEILAASPHLKPGVVEINPDAAIQDDGILVELQALPEASRITKLAMYEYKVTDRALLAIRENPHLTRVSELSLHFCKITRVGLDALADWPGLRTLKSFRFTTSVNHRCCYGKSFDKLLRSPHWGDLETFYLCGHRLGDDGTVALAAAKFGPSLRKVELHYQDIGDTGVIALARAGHFLAVTELHLGSNEKITTPAIVALAQSAPWPSLEKLELYGCKVGDEGAQALAESTAFPRLNYLNLADSLIGDKGVTALTRAPWFAQLRELYLGQNKITGQSLRALAACSGHGELLRLDLGISAFNDTAAAVLARSPFLQRVWRLDMDKCQLGSKAVSALARSPHVGKVRILDLKQNTIGDAGVKALAKSTSLTALERLVLDGTECTEVAVDALLQWPIAGQLKQLNFKYSGEGKQRLKDRFGKVLSLD